MCRHDTLTYPGGIGAIPDIVINNTLQDVQEGHDILLERAIEELNR